MQRITSFTILSLLLGVSAQAEKQLDPVTVTTSRLNLRGLDDTIIEIDRTHRPNLLAEFQRQPNITAFNKGGYGGGSYLAIRGGEPNFTLVLLDGVRVNDPSNSAGGAFDFGQLDPSVISRITVSKTGASSIHGPDALSGVVNLETVSPHDSRLPRSTFQANLKTKEAWSLAGTHNRVWDNGGAIVSVAVSDTGMLTEDSTSQRLQGFSKLEHEIFGGSFRLSGISSQNKRTAFPEDSGGALYAQSPELADYKTRFNFVSAAYQRPLAPNLRLAWLTGFTRQDLKSDIPAIPDGVLNGVPARTDNTRFERWDTNAFLTFQSAPDFDLAIGAQLASEQASGDGVLDFGFPVPTEFDETRTVFGLFAELQAQLNDRMTIGTALRWDRPDNDRPSLTGRISTEFAVSERMQASVKWNSSYKLPSLFATAYPLIANPDLLAESGESIELSMTYNNSDGGVLSASLFQTKFTDLIDFDPVLFVNVNRSRVASQGIEVFASTPLVHAFRITSSLGFLDIDSSSMQPLRNRPETSATMSLDWQPSGALSANLALSTNSNVFSSSIPTGFVVLDGFYKLDARLNWSPSPAWQVSLELSNLTGEKYAFDVGNFEPRRNASLSIRSSF